MITIMAKATSLIRRTNMPNMRFLPHLLEKHGVAPSCGLPVGCIVTVVFSYYLKIRLQTPESEFDSP
jgi:hypothetical protein